MRTETGYKHLYFAIAVGAIVFAAQSALGMFMFTPRTPIPISRLMANLEEVLTKKPGDFETLYNLARLHSMAYAVATNTIDVDPKGDAVFSYPSDSSGVPRKIDRRTSHGDIAAAMSHLTNAIVIYKQALSHARSATNQWLILPTHVGYAWCLDQAGKKEEALAAYRRALAIAWHEEVVGDFSLQRWLEDRWEDIRAGKLQTHHRGFIGPGVCVSDEVIGYMLPLLDAKKDADEIADLHQRQKEILSMGRAITPILVPTGGKTELSDLTDSNARVRFDLDDSGIQRKWAWPTTNAAWLVYAPDKEAPITSGLQLVGGVAFWVFWRDGYAALSALDDNHDGQLTGAELNGLALWQDLNSNGINEPGEVRSLAGWGIVQLSCQRDRHSTGIPFNPAGVRFSSGRIAPTYDWISTGDPAMR